VKLYKVTKIMKEISEVELPDDVILTDEEIINSALDPARVFLVRATVVPVTRREETK